MNSSTSSPQPTIPNSNPAPQQRVLLVEDNEMGRQMVRAMLEYHQLQVTEAEDGAQALAKAAADNFDLVLMDIQMPVMDGIAAAKAIRRLDHPNATIPIIAMTAYIVEEVEQQFTLAGFNGCISKPIELDTLRGQLQCWLSGLPVSPVVKNISLDTLTDLQQALPNIDVAAALSRTSGNCQLYRNLLRKFSNQFSASASQLEQEIAADNFQSARFMVHNLKGAAAALGAADLQHCATDLEVQLANEQLPAALAGTLVELQNFLQLIDQLPVEAKAVQDPPAASPHGSSSELHTLLLGLRTPLNKLQINQVRQYLVQLEEKQWPEQFYSQLQQLTEYVDNYQFSPAGEVLEALLMASAE